MTKRDIPVPICTICGESGNGQHVKGEPFYLCKNCGTEMRYRPAGELLNSGSKKAIENNGWAVSFSVRSSELYSAQAMVALGIALIVLAVFFVWSGKLENDAALWSIGSGVFLSIIGGRKSIKQKKKSQLILSQFPYWKKERL